MIPAIADLPPMQQERVVCSIAASAQYRIPANVVLAVAETEGGKPGQWVRNTNGTHDVGPLQFNTSYLGTLAKYGISTDDVAAAGCYAYQLAAWRIALHIQHDSGDIWQRAANYHSRTPYYNGIYRGKLVAAGARWGAWLDKHFKTIDVDGKPRTASPTITAQALPAAPANGQAKPVASKAKPAQLDGYVPRQVAVNIKASEL
jgi:hypothetical protein